MRILGILEKMRIKKARDNYEPKELQEIKKKVIEVANILWKEIETVQEKIEVQKHEINKTKARIEILGRERAILLHMYLLLAEELFVWRELKMRLEQLQRKLKELEEKYAHELEEFQKIITKIENTNFSKGSEGIDPELVELANLSLEDFKDLDELSSKLKEIEEKIALIQQEIKGSSEGSKINLRKMVNK